MSSSSGLRVFKALLTAGYLSHVSCVDCLLCYRAGVRVMAINVVLCDALQCAANDSL